MTAKLSKERAVSAGSLSGESLTALHSCCICQVSRLSVPWSEVHVTSTTVDYISPSPDLNSALMNNMLLILSKYCDPALMSACSVCHQRYDFGDGCQPALSSVELSSKGTMSVL